MHCLIVRLNIRPQVTLESMVAAILIEALRNSRLQQGLNFATRAHPTLIMIFENKSRELFLFVVIHSPDGTILHSYISYICIWFYVEENTADIQFFKNLDGRKKTSFQIYGKRSNKIL